MDKDEFVKIEIVSGCEGNSLYINNYRVTGSKPWGGGNVVHTFNAKREDIFRALNINN